MYKYRFWEDQYHKKVLLYNELYFASPKRFNDPYDCGLPFKQHPDNSDPLKIKYKVEASALRQFPDLADNPQALEEKCARQVMLIQPNPGSWFEMNWGYKPEDLSKLFGVLSLTPHPDNYLMWSHYSNCHQGFCVEFNTRKLIESVAGHFQKVEYSDDIPQFSIMDTLEDGLMAKLIYTKSRLWEYEDEYRLTRIHKPDHAIQFDPAALTGVYFGCKSPYEHQIEIIKIVQEKYPWAKIKRMDLCKDSFKLIQVDIALL